MDIKCVKCGEPWDMDSLHEQIAEEYGTRSQQGITQKEYEERYYDPMKAKFFKKGCEALGSSHNGNTNSNSYAMGVLYSEFGDDLDGLASMMEDFGL